MADGLEERLRLALAPLSEHLTVCRAGQEPPESLSRPLGGGLSLCCPPDEPGADALLTLASTLAAVLSRESPDERWRQRLQAPAGAADELAWPCCALLLRSPAKLPAGLRDAVPLRERDAWVPLDPMSAALVRDMSGADLAETVEYANALRDSLLAELGCEVVLGVGGVGRDPARSFREAERALCIGRRYDPERTVCVWQSLIVERIADELPPERAARYRALLFNPETARVLDGELLTTALTFLRSSLNLSDTARRLYIHRSTLMYRLDKIQKATGLDLRCFDDAMTFRLLHTLRAAEDETTHKEDSGI